MICAEIRSAGRYLGLNPALDAALRHLLSGGPAALRPGDRAELLPDGSAYVSCFAYDTVPEEGALFEAHERWGDVHVVLSGAERVNLAPPARLTVVERQEERDYIALTGEAQASAVLRPGVFLAVFPEDAHQIKLCLGRSAPVVKAVYKFLL